MAEWLKTCPLKSGGGVSEERGPHAQGGPWALLCHPIRLRGGVSEPEPTLTFLAGVQPGASADGVSLMGTWVPWSWPLPARLFSGKI